MCRRLLSLQQIGSMSRMRSRATTTRPIRIRARRKCKCQPEASAKTWPRQVRPSSRAATRPPPTRRLLTTGLTSLSASARWRRLPTRQSLRRAQIKSRAKQFCYPNARRLISRARPPARRLPGAHSGRLIWPTIAVDGRLSPPAIERGGQNNGQLVPLGARLMIKRRASWHPAGNLLRV